MSVPVKFQDQNVTEGLNGSTAGAAERRRFVDAIALCGSVKSAIESTGIPAYRLYEWRKVDQEFDAAWTAAIEIGREIRREEMEEEAHRRAMDGSDTLMIFMLKAYDPARFREPRGQTSVDVNLSVDLRSRSVEDMRAELADLVRRDPGLITGANAEDDDANGFRG